MVVIGGMRSFLGPALGALFFVVFRDYLSSVTENWLLYFGLLFVAFIVFSPTGLVGVAERVLRPLPQASDRGRGDGGAPGRRDDAAGVPQARLARRRARSSTSSGIAKSFGGIRAVRGVSFAVRDRTLHALIGPNGAGKTTAFNLISGMFTPDTGHVDARGRDDRAGCRRKRSRSAGIGRSFQITNLFPTLSIEENVRLACRRATRTRFNIWRRPRGLDNVNARDRRGAVDHGPRRRREGAKPARCPMAASGCSTWRWRWRRKPRVLLLDEPLAGLAAAERERVGRLIKEISRDIPVLLVEHDIDRVFQLADHVTVMNDGAGAGRRHGRGRALDRRRCRRSTSAPAPMRWPSKARPTRGAGRVAAAARRRRHLLRQEPHPARRDASTCAQNEIVALLGRNGAGKSTVLKTIIGIAPPAHGHDRARRRRARRPAVGRGRPGAASPTCRRAAACSPA